MKTAVLSVAFYSENFSKVFIGSFRRHYPKTPLVIVDNNMVAVEEDATIGCVGRRETSFLEENTSIIYVKNNKQNKSHGIGLDIGINYLAGKFKLVIVVDIDSLFLKPGLVDKIESYYRKGFIWGGRQHLLKHKNKKYTHPSLAFYPVDALYYNCLSFEDETSGNALSTGEKIHDILFRELKAPPANHDFGDYVYHFGGGSMLRLGASYCKNKLLNTEKYQRKWGTFFSREDVKEYL